MPRCRRGVRQRQGPHIAAAARRDAGQPVQTRAARHAEKAPSQPGRTRVGRGNDGRPARPAHRTSQQTAGPISLPAGRHLYAFLHGAPPYRSAYRRSGGRSPPQSRHRGGRSRPWMPWKDGSPAPRSPSVRRWRSSNKAIESAPPEQAAMTLSPDLNRPCRRAVVQQSLIHTLYKVFPRQNSWAHPDC